MEKFYQITKKNEKLDSNDFKRILELYHENKDFKEYFDDFDTKKKFTLKKFDSYIEKKKEEDKLKKEEEELLQQLNEANAKLDAFYAKKKNQLFVREFLGKHNNLKYIEVITQKNLDQMSNESGKNESEEIDVKKALKMLKNYIDDNETSIEGKLKINVLAEKGYVTYGTLRSLEVLRHLTDFDSEEYKFEKIYAISVVWK